MRRSSVSCMCAALLCLPLAAALRLPENFNGFIRPPTPLSLPPAAVRDVAAEAVAAASMLRKDVLPLTGEPEKKPLVMIAVRAGAYQQCIAELVQHCTGKREGTSWVRPLALRRAANISVAVAAEAFDPTLGWLDSDVGESTIHMFSALAPAAFVPTSRLCDVPPALAVAVRTLHQAHEATADDLVSADQPVSHNDYGVLQAFMALIANDDDGSRDPDLYDPLANL